MKSYVKQALTDLHTAISLTVKDDNVDVDEFTLYRSMERAIDRVVADYSKQINREEKKKVAPGATNTEGDKEIQNRNQYTMASVEIQVIPWELLSVSTKSILSDLFRGGELL